MAVPAGPRELPVPPCNADASQRRPVHQERRTAPLRLAFEDPEQRPHPWVSTAQQPASPQADEPADNQHGTYIETERKQPAVLLLLLGVAQTADGLLGNVAREVEQRGEKQADQERAVDEGYLVDE